MNIMSKCGRFGKSNTRHKDKRKRHGDVRSMLCELLEPRVLLDADPVITDFAVFGQSEVTIAEKSIVNHGFVGSDGNVEVKKETQIKSVFAGGKIEIDKDSNVAGSLRANDRIEVEKSTSVQGNIDGGGKVDLDDDVAVKGDVTSASRVKLSSGVTVSGNVVEFGTPANYSAIRLPSLSAIATDPPNDIVTGANETLVLEPGSYGDLQLGKVPRGSW